jgi:hypothetical protein
MVKGHVNPVVVISTVWASSYTHYDRSSIRIGYTSESSSGSERDDDTG